jgi:hypothetical protein
MANPVVFFDMTVGGAPAGRIEMTVRPPPPPRIRSEEKRRCPIVDAIDPIDRDDPPSTARDPRSSLASFRLFPPPRRIARVR